MMNSRLKNKRILSFFLLCIIGLAACAAADLPKLREETAERLAAPAWMIKRDITAEGFTMRAYERMHERFAPATLYIEGDSEQAISRTGLTPTDPIGLHLATKDKAENVVYLARPCQYQAAYGSKAEECAMKYTREARYSPEIIAAISAAMDDIASHYDISGFHLVGYDGGATIAALLAAQRKDVLSLRSVAGVFDVGALNASAKTTEHLKNMPQIHFIGDKDMIATKAAQQPFLGCVAPSACVQSKLVDDAAHADGWVNKWPDLLETPVSCFRKRNFEDAYLAETSAPQDDILTSPSTLDETYKPIKSKSPFPQHPEKP